MHNEPGRSLNKEEIYLAKKIRLRKELWGGIVFDQDNGTVIDLDREAFTLLSWLWGKKAVEVEELLVAPPGQAQGKKAAAKYRNNAVAVLQQFLDLGIIKIRRGDFPGEHVLGSDAGKLPLRPKNLLSAASFPQPQNGDLPLSAPETVHWAITFRCLQNCPDCYARRYREQGLAGLSTADALQVVENLARWGVFQLAIGGGEPLLRPDLPRIVREAKDGGLTVHVTTGLIRDFDFKLLEQLAPALKSLHIGIKQDLLLARPQTEKRYLRQIIQAAQTLGVNTGANLVLCRTVLEHFEQIMENLVQGGFRRIILLPYKPPFDVDHWLAENPPPETFANFKTVLRKTAKLAPHVELRLDCALSFLQRDLSPQEALSAGLRGCVAANRVMALAADGSMYPCSQLMDARFKAGNVLSKDFRSFWKAKPMTKYRFFRRKRSFLETNCGTCLAREQCGGCRVFAHDALGEDLGCKEPLFPPDWQLGRAGRKAALKNYFEKHFSISVGQYMEHFHVGQKKAVQELKNMDWLMLEGVGSDGRKKVDTYIKTDAYLLEEIQAGIGFTSGGAPFVSLEEISAGIKEPNLQSYPKWLLRNRPE